ncbi:MAG: hypothetical protein MJ237_06600 [bacterium]|nr:hypothetical protein [bacterium]
MKKIFFTLFLLILTLTFQCPVNAKAKCFESLTDKKQELAIKYLLHSQVRYANKYNYDKLITTYDKNYVSSDGLNLNDYTNLIKDIWKSYEHMKYRMKIKDIKISGDTAIVKTDETSSADIPSTKKFTGKLLSYSDSVYYLKKIDGKWKVYSDEVLDEKTSMLYGDALNMKANLIVPLTIAPNVEYTATLEMLPMENTVAIASIASDVIEYPQKPTEEIFRAMPEDNILERLFTSNTQNKNEYVVATVGLTRAEYGEMSFKISLTGFGYLVRRVNVKNEQNECVND